MFLSRETNDTLDVAHKTKRYIFRRKTGVVSPKGTFTPRRTPLAKVQGGADTIFQEAS